MEIALSPDMLGRTFNGIGEPIDDLGPIVSKLKRDVNGLPLNPVFDEIVEFVIGGSERKIGRIIELYEDKAVIQVFEGSENMSLKNTHTRLTGHPMEIALSPDMLGRTFNGIGEPIDDLGPIVSKLKRDVNGLPLNPVMREYPRNYIPGYAGSYIQRNRRTH